MILENNYQKQQNQEYCFFLFVNTGSGSNQGNLLLQQQVQRIQFVLSSQDPLQTSYRCSVFIYNMRINRQEGFKRLKKQSSVNGNKCYAIVCGGDGTVMWVVTQIIKYDIKILSIPICIIPFGTGNDFARELGWGYDKTGLLDNGFKNLKKQIRKWLKAKQEYFDVWDIEAEIYDNGKFQKVDNSANKLIEGKIIKRTFCNYFSFGIDGKIGYGFDMHRTKTRFGNLAMYACMGLVKTLTRTKSLDELLDSIQVSTIRQSDRKSSQIRFSSQNQPQLHKSISFRSSKHYSIQSNLSNFDKATIFEKNYYNILALNINSYTGGVKNIWQNSKTGFIQDKKFQQEYEESSTGDGKLDIVSFGSSFGIALQRMIGGNSRKVAQGQGPFVFNFHQYENKSKHRTYLQIDGQFIRFTNPKKITITHSQFVPKGKIKVLRNIQQNK